MDGIPPIAATAASNLGETPDPTPVPQEKAGMQFVSIDPGEINCAVVRYDQKKDLITRARLYNLLCMCPPALRGTGPMEQSLLGEPQEQGVVPGIGNHKSGKAGVRRKPKIRVPSSHDLPAQLLSRIRDDAAKGPFGHKGLVGSRLTSTSFADSLPRRQLMVVVEKQEAVNSKNMVVESCLLTHFYGHSVLQDPKLVKAFWNQAADVAGLPPVYRPGGSRAMKKADAKAMFSRILALQEQNVIRKAFQSHGAHLRVCPAILQRDRKKKKPRKRVTKEDDLMDAVLQAICVAQLHAGQQPEDPAGPAIRRLQRGAVRIKLEKEADAMFRQTSTSKSKRQQHRRRHRRSKSNDRKKQKPSTKKGTGIRKRKQRPTTTTTDGNKQTSRKKLKIHVQTHNGGTTTVPSSLQQVREAFLSGGTE